MFFGYSILCLTFSSLDLTFFIVFDLRLLNGSLHYLSKRSSDSFTRSHKKSTTLSPSWVASLICSLEHPFVSKTIILIFSMYIPKGSSFPCQIVFKKSLPFLVNFAPANFSRNYFDNYLNKEIEPSFSFMYHARVALVRKMGTPLSINAWFSPCITIQSW